MNLIPPPEKAGDYIYELIQQIYGFIFSSFDQYPSALYKDLVGIIDSNPFWNYNQHNPWHVCEYTMG